MYLDTKWTKKPKNNARKSKVFRNITLFKSINLQANSMSLESGQSGLLLSLFFSSSDLFCCVCFSERSTRSIRRKWSPTHSQCGTDLQLYIFVKTKTQQQTSHIPQKELFFLTVKQNIYATSIGHHVSPTVSTLMADLTWSVISRPTLTFYSADWS